jgi:hypothetical protein
LLRSRCFAGLFIAVLMAILRRAGPMARLAGGGCALVTVLGSGIDEG